MGEIQALGMLTFRPHEAAVGEGQTR